VKVSNVSAHQTLTQLIVDCHGLQAKLDEFALSFNLTRDDSCDFFLDKVVLLAQQIFKREWFSFQREHTSLLFVILGGLIDEIEQWSLQVDFFTKQFSPEIVTKNYIVRLVHEKNRVIRFLKKLFELGLLPCCYLFFNNNGGEVLLNLVLMEDDETTQNRHV
jgi:hypothetical protein